MAKDGRVGTFAVPVKVLGDDSRDGHGHADEAVVVNTDPVNVEPSETAFGSTPRSALATTALCEPVYRHDPRFDRVHFAEEFLLRMQVGSYIMTEESKEGCNREGFVTIGNYLEVDGMPVPLDLQKRRNGVNGDHEQDANDISLFLGLGVVQGMHPDEV